MEHRGYFEKDFDFEEVLKMFLSLTAFKHFRGSHPMGPTFSNLWKAQFFTLPGVHCPLSSSASHTYSDSLLSKISTKRCLTLVIE